jgi:N-acetylneuraminic acid mutarotase
MRMRALLLSAVVACGRPAAPVTSDALLNDTLADAAADGATGDAACLQNALFEAHPRFGVADARLHLEGSFAQSMSVDFTNAVGISPSEVGAHRAVVSVPASALTGWLTAECGAPLEFQKLTYAPGIRTFRADYDQSGYGARSAQLRLSRAGLASVKVGAALYVIGGSSANGWETSSERAVINADGSLGQFAPATGSALTIPRAFHSAVRIGRFVYVIGGRIDSAIWNTVERAEVQSDGNTIGAFATLPNVTLVKARALHATAVIGNHLYVFGGIGTTAMSPIGTPLDSVERAVINIDGTLGPFEVVPTAKLASVRLGHTANVIGNFVYVVGGSDNNAHVTDIERASIDSDGNVGAFASVPGVALQTLRSNHQSFVVDDQLYVLGGYGSSDELRSIEQTTVHADGTIDSFATSAIELSTKRQSFSVVHVGNYLYALSGQSLPGGALPASCERASLHGGDLSSFVSYPETLVAQAGHHALVSGNHVYVFAGLAATQHAAVQTTGELTAFSSGPSLVTPRAGAAVARVWNHLYVIGGHTASTTALATFERSTLADDGALGAFATYPVTSLATARDRAAAVVIGEKLIVIGGTNASGNALSTVEHATINPGGSLGPSATLAGVTLATPRSGHTVTVIGSRVYVVGGHDNAGQSLATIESATIEADGSLSTFQVVGSLQSARDGHSTVVNGNNLYVIGGAANGQPLTTFERAVVAADGSLGAFAEAGTLGARTDAALAAVGNYVYLLGGRDTTGAVGTILRATLQ